MSRSNRSHGSRRLLAAAAMVTVAAAAMLATPAASQAAGRPVGPLSPDKGVLFGAMTNENRANPDGTVAEVRALESQIGRKLAIDHRFYTYKEEFFPNDPAVGMSDEAWDWANGRYSMITWGATDTYAYENGSQDAWVTAQARRMAAFGHPIFLRFYHEPDGDYRKNQVHTAADYIAAWRHVHDLFLKAGATNVVWVWCPTAWKFNLKDPTPPSFYPGDDVVDWIAADGYDWAPTKPGAQWRSFAQVFQKFYNWAITKNKPLMAAEYGVLEDPSYAGGNRKAQWFNDMLTTLQTTMTQFQAILYFDTTMTKGGSSYVWNLTSSAPSINAWSNAGANAYLGAVPQIP